MTRMWGWAQLTFEYLLSQVFGQALGFLAGLFLIRAMTVSEYAAYALYSSVLGFISVSTDLGLIGSIAYFRRKCIQAGVGYEAYVVAVRRIRIGFLVLAGASFLVLALLVGRSTTAGMEELVGGCLVFLIAWVQTRAAISVGLLRLAGRFRYSYYCEAMGSFSRFILAAIMLTVGIGAAWFALLVNLVGSLVISVSSLFGGVSQVASKASPSRSTYREVIRYILPIAPGALLFSVQDLAILWLAGYFGGRTIIAETFALGRIGVLIGVAGGFLSVVISKLSNITDESRYTRVFFSTVAAAMCAGVCFLAAARLFPDIFLSLLGKNYTHLTSELNIAMATASVGVLANLVVSGNRARGWVRLEPVVTVISVITIVLLCFNWSFQTTSDVLMLQLAVAMLGFFLHLASSGVGFLFPNSIQIRTPMAS